MHKKQVGNVKKKIGFEFIWEKTFRRLSLNSSGASLSPLTGTGAVTKWKQSDEET